MVKKLLIYAFDSNVAGNVLNMKPVQKCARFVFCAFSAIEVFKL